MVHPIALRPPDNLYQRVVALAAREHRSIHAQMLWLIERGLVEAE